MIPELLLGLVHEDGRRWGEVAVDFQREDADAILDPTRPARQHFLTRPRGASKTTDLAAIVLTALLEQLPAGAQAYAVAADRDQAQLLLREVAGFVGRSGLGDHVQVDNYKATTNSGTTLTALAADDAGAYGLRPHFVVVDELAQWNTSGKPQRMYDAVFSAIPKVAASRFVVITTAGDPAHWSRRILDHALQSPSWRVHEVPGPTPWLDPVALQEQEASLLPSQYARLHLNQWVAAEDRLTTPEDLAECVGHTGPLDYVHGNTYAVGLDIGLKNDKSVMTVCHSPQPTADQPHRTVVVDRQVVWSGTRSKPVDLADVEATFRHVHQSYNRPTLVVDPYQAALLTSNLRRSGMRVEEYTFTQQSIGRLAQRMWQLLSQHALVLPDDPELLDELSNVRIRETSPGVYRMDHDANRHDDRAISLALAANYLLTKAPQRRTLSYGGHQYAPVGDIPYQAPKPALVSDESFPGMSEYLAGP
jgi:phage terminase large subunit-like protein